MDYTKFIDSVVGNIARKIEDEFNENDHPRDKGGKFTSKGGEGKGGSKDPIPETETEKAAKEELKGSTKSDEETLDTLLEYCSDLDTINEALMALNWVDHDFDDYEKAKAALKEAVSQKPELAKELAEDARIGYDENVHWKKKESDTPDYLKYEGDSPEGKETDRIYEEFKSSGIDMYAALSDLGLDVFNTPESYLEDAFKEALFNSNKFRKKAASYIKQYRNTEDEEEWFK